LVSINKATAKNKEVTSEKIKPARQRLNPSNRYCAKHLRVDRINSLDVNMRDIQAIRTQQRITKYLKDQGFGMAHVAAMALTAIGLKPSEIAALGIPPKFTRESLKIGAQFFNCANQKELVEFLLSKAV
jgi:hypothetical protein